MLKISLSLVMLIPGIMMALVGFVTSYTVLGDITLSAVRNEGIKAMIELMYHMSNAGLSTIGFTTAIKGKVR